MWRRFLERFSKPKPPETRLWLIPPGGSEPLIWVRDPEIMANYLAKGWRLAEAPPVVDELRRAGM